MPRDGTPSHKCCLWWSSATLIEKLLVAETVQ